MPVGGSLVILMEASRMLCGMMWFSGLGAGSALRKILYRAHVQDVARN